MERTAATFVDRFIRRSEAEGPDDVFAARLLAVTLLVALGASAAFAFAQAQAGNWRLSAVQAAAALLAGVLLFALSRLPSRAPIAHALCIIVTAQVTLINVFSGGVELPAMAFFSVSPLVALMAVGRRSAWIWLGVGVALILGLNVAQALGVVFPVGPPRNRWVDALALVLLAVIVLTLAASHAALSRRALEALRLANHQLADARARAEAANAAKDRLIATVSHELRTPLTGAIGFARLLDEAHLPAPHGENARAALASAETLLGISNDILDRARLATGKLEMQSVPFDLNRLLDDVVRVGAVTASEKGVAVLLHNEAPQFLIGDPTRLKQVLLNLVGNAVKFTPQGSVVVRVTADAASQHFAVTDSGVGIAVDARERIFLPYVQAASPRRFGGAGIGLSVAKELVEGMGGTLRVESAEGVGSTFAFSLSLAPAPSAEAREDVVTRRPPLAMRVLAVDDDAVNRLLIARLLEQMGAECTLASSGQGALEAIARTVYDAVLLDCEMPHIDGYEVARRVRAGESPGEHLPVLALTGSALPEDRARARAAGMDDLIAKPFALNEIYLWLHALPRRTATAHADDTAGNASSP